MISTSVVPAYRFGLSGDGVKSQFVLVIVASVSLPNRLSNEAYNRRLEGKRPSVALAGAENPRAARTVSDASAEARAFMWGSSLRPRDSGGLSAEHRRETFRRPGGDARYWTRGRPFEQGFAPSKPGEVPRTRVRETPR